VSNPIRRNSCDRTSPVSAASLTGQARPDRRLAGAPVPSGGLARLADTDRDVLLLVALAGLGYAGTGFALSIPEGTVASRLNRARRRLVSALGGTDPTSIFNERQDATPRSQHPGPPDSTAPPGVKPRPER